MESIFSVQPVLLLQDAAKPFIRTVLACKCHIQFLQRWHRFYWHLFVFVIVQEALAVSQLATVITYPASFCKKKCHHMYVIRKKTGKTICGAEGPRHTRILEAGSVCEDL